MNRSEREDLVGTLDELLGRAAACTVTRDYLGDTIEAVRTARAYFRKPDAAAIAEREACAQIASALDSNRGNEKEIAKAILARE
jgi:hypothetical protein